jgi:predicted GNAT family N-acyltransferase
VAGEVEEVRFEPLSRRHERAGFDCGEPALDTFLRRFARQNQERGVSRTYVLVRGEDPRVLGYVTLSAGSVANDALPEEDRRRLPRYPVPVVHLGRLAVARSERGHGLGERLLMDALEVALRASRAVGAFAVEVVAKGEASRAFYARYGFRSMDDDPLHMYLATRTVEQAFDRAAGDSGPSSR